jgi:hypothetical protein
MDGFLYHLTSYSTDCNIKLSGEKIRIINGHKVGVQIADNDIISAKYAVDSDNEGVRLLTILIE